MLRINAIPNSSAAKNYYKAENADYYLEGQEQAATWHGRGAEMLGLSGPVQQSDFEALCENINPATGKQLTAKHVENRRVGYDFTWSVPKSVSIAATLGLDDRLPDAFRGAVADTMAEMEREMQTRVRRGGRNENRTTGNMIWADFLHQTSRPIGGQPDPQIHLHAVAFNATFDREEGQWKAGEFAHIKANAPYFQAVFRSRLAGRLQALGYQLRQTKGDFEIEDIPARAIKEFSRRTAQIEKTAAELGITRPETKGELGKTTREKKSAGMTWEELRQLWIARLRPGEMAAIERTVKEANRPRKVPDLTQEAVQYALDHLTYRDSVVPERQVVTEALKYGIGGVTPESVYRELGKRKDLIRRQKDGQDVISTKTVLNEERFITDFGQKGRGRYRPLGGDLQHRGCPSAQGTPLEGLTASQQDAIRHVWRSQDRLILVRGLAGTGKTTALKTALDGVNVPFVAVAPSSQASRGELRKAGIEGAETLAKLLIDETLQARAKDGLIVLDEASMAGAREVSDLFKLADKLNTRVLMLGDRRQHKSVSRGDVLAMLEDRGGLPVAEVSEIKRQSGQYREAVEKLARGDVVGGFKRLDALGWVREGGHEAAADEYVAALEAGKTAQIISPTHIEGESVAALVRQRLKERGKLKGEDRTVRRLVPLNWTPAEMAKARKEGPEPGVVMERYAAYREETQPLAVGDLVRTDARMKDAAGKWIDNGTVMTVTGFSASGNVKVSMPSGQARTLPADGGHFKQAYAVTSHAAQGKTVDRIIIAQGEQSFPASGKEQFYVSVSRGRERATVITSDKAALKEAIQREDTRMLALDLIRTPRKGIKKALKRRVQFLRELVRRIHAHNKDQVVERSHTLSRER